MAVLMGVTWPQITRHLFAVELPCDNEPGGGWLRRPDRPRTVLCVEYKPHVDGLPLFPKREFKSLSDSILDVETKRYKIQTALKAITSLPHKN